MNRASYRNRSRPTQTPVGTVVFATGAVALLAVGLFLWAQPARGVVRSRKLPAGVDRLIELHAPLPPPRENDWRNGPGEDERGQTYDSWRASKPRTARGPRRVLYMAIIGALDPARREIVEQAVRFLGMYFGLEVKRLAPIAVDDNWPAAARRAFDDGSVQLLTRHILDRELRPRLPEDAAALLGLTAYDLWPGDGWNFVFGVASLRRRIGVWSIARFGDPARSTASRLQCLRRTLKVATHETGHMFGLEHCLAYACNMCGSNTMDETDRHPLWLCPECLPKLWDATGVAPIERFTRLAAFARVSGLITEAAFFEASRKRLTEAR